MEIIDAVGSPNVQVYNDVAKFQPKWDTIFMRKSDGWAKKIL